MDWSSIFTIENMKILGTFLGTIFGALIVVRKSFKEQISKYMPSTDIPKKINRQSNLDIRIQNRMETLKEMFNADRIQIYEFHNGGHYANGRSALKTTCTYETCRYGIKSSQKEMSCIPLSCIPNFMTKLLSSGYVEVKDIELIKSKMPSTYELKKNIDVKSFYSNIIKNMDGDPVGFVSIQFCQNEYKIDEKEVANFIGFLEEALSQLMS